MRRTLPFVALPVLLLIGGCNGRGKSALEAALHDFAESVNVARKSLAQVEGTDSAQRAAQSLKAETHRVRDLTGGLVALAAPLGEDRERVKRALLAIGDASKRFGQESKDLLARLTRLELPRADARELVNRIKEFAEAMKDWSEAARAKRQREGW